MPAFDLVAFDLYGILLDISELASGMRLIAGEGAAALLERWRKVQLERAGGSTGSAATNRGTQ